MVGPGDNPITNNGYIWIGDDGPNTFTFTNKAESPVVVILWDFPYNDYEASFMNVRHPKISYSLPNQNDTVNISIANGISGGWSALINRETQLKFGQISNTWGEFTTGRYATVDISREANMQGTTMSVRTSAGCVSDMDTCVFVCKTGDTCGESGTYALQNCQPGSQAGATYGNSGRSDPSGGCQGWSYGGQLQIIIGNHTTYTTR
ncbi:hypothetical protein QQS21_011903 [Conoideocrella luteorostrata]|uniref:Uncharacterized protein n=1 Tax=Conoideocrella luteorostrata TaxID=1105319 RepID=A0AAJ0CCF7_9HYPO|nr:hypothetical protein QQS21_011903 [Conoideocrella luteorostrata]